MTCLITGCVATNGYKWVGGDLHLIAGAFVFVAIAESQGGNCAWRDREFYSHYNKEVDFSETDNIERGHMIVADAQFCKLNQAAKEYIAKEPVFRSLTFLGDYYG